MEENDSTEKNGQIVKSGSEGVEVAKSSLSSRALELIRSIDDSKISSVIPPSTAIDKTNTDSSLIAHELKNAYLKLRINERYSRLKYFLLNKQWLDADNETKEIIIEICGRQGQSWLRVQDLKRLPCEDLQTIDRLWMEHSSNHFGISTQKELFKKFWNGSESIAYHSKWCKFGELVGWRNNLSWGRAIAMDEWLAASPTNERASKYRKVEDFPVGFFPRICRLRVEGYVWWAGAPRLPWGAVYCALMLRFQQCDSVQE